MLNQKLLSSILLLLSLILFFNASVAMSTAPPTLPYRIGGTLTVNDTVITDDSQTLYVIMVTKLDDNLSPTCIIGTDTVGMGKSSYTIDIPLSEANADCWTASKTLIGIHIYDGYNGLDIAQLAIGKDEDRILYSSNYLIGNAGEWQYVNIKAVSPPMGSGTISASEMTTAIQDAILERACEQFDVGNDGVVGLAEAINALRVLTQKED